MTPLFIAGYNQGGLVTDKKPFMLPNEAFSQLENAYVWRDRVKKRESLKFLGRLQRNFSSYAFFTTSASPWTFSLKVVTGFVSTADNANPGKVTTTYPHGLTNGDSVMISGVVGAVGYNTNSPFVITVVDATNFTVGANAGAYGAYVSGGHWISNRSLSATEPNSEIVAGSVVITLAGPIVLTDQGDGTLTSPTAGNSGTINYVSGSVTLTHTAGVGAAVTVSYSYYPALPVMGIWQREIAGINNEQTIFFDTRYAYIFLGSAFQEFIAGTAWAASDSDFFWAANYRGSSPENRLFFVTNNLNNAADPMRYTDGTTWTTFAPQVDAAGGGNYLFQARVLIPYYGRLLALNCTEGANIAGAVNIFNRCRFSQIGSPVASDAWRSDQYGKGGFIDAPINESIISATFIKNTLLVQFERSTWQLRYVGEYGLPFIWERVSSDFGSESTFSPVIFDDGILAVGDRAIISANAVTVARIDEQVPDLVFDIRNAELGTIRVWGIRDYQKELVFWNYSDSQLGRKFPNKVICYNYRNQTYAIFRDNVTAFGVFQPATAVTWDSTDVFWDDDNVFWDDVQVQSQFPITVSGNQQGFVHYYGYSTIEEKSLAITAVDTSVSPNTLTIPNHNLEDGEIIQVQGCLFSGTDPLINDILYCVTRIDANTISTSTWDGTIYVSTPIAAAGTYIGEGVVILYPRLFVQTKDYNPYLTQGNQLKIIYVDFLTENTGANTAFSVDLYVNTSDSVKANVLTGNQESETYLPSPYYVPNSDIAWHRFYATSNGQFIRIIMTFDNDLMDDQTNLDSDWVLNAMTLWVRPGSKVIF